MLLCAALALCCNILANRRSAISAGRITKKLRHDLFGKLENLSARQMDKLTVSSAVSRLTSDSYNFNQMVARVQRMGIRAPILLVGGVMMMLTKDWVLALVLIALMPLLSFVVFKATPKALPLRFEAQGVLDDMVQVSQENITGSRVIKALSKTEYEKNRFGQVNKKLSSTILKADLYTIISNPATNLLLNVGLTLVVLVGAYRVNAGAGKTTIINLLMRFYDVDGGTIYVDGKDIRTLTRDSLRRAYTMVLQDTWLFQGTIYDNIAYGKPDATMDDVVRAAKAAHIHSYISRLPDGYNTVLSDNGTSISKGQKQLLTIARAMLLDAHMLILDEATSNVDTRTEQRIQAAMTKLMQNAAGKIFGEENVLPNPPGMGAEDFGYFADEAPGCYYRFGVGDPKAESYYPLHNSQFQLDPEALTYAVALYTQIADDFLKQG